MVEPMNSLFVKILDERKNLSWKLVLENLDAFFAEDKKIFLRPFRHPLPCEEIVQEKEKIRQHMYVFGKQKKSKPNLDP